MDKHETSDIEPHNLIADRLEKILEDASRPNADFPRLTALVLGVDADITGEHISHQAIARAKSATENCLGPRKLARYQPDAWAKISSLRKTGDHIQKNSSGEPS